MSPKPAAQALAQFRTETGLDLPDDLSFEEWVECGKLLGRAGTALAWAIGDWWTHGEHRYGDRTAVVKTKDWAGPAYQTCANTAVVCKKFETYRRRYNLTFSHHAEVAHLPADEADRYLDWCEQDDGEHRSTRALRAKIRQDREPHIAAPSETTDADSPPPPTEQIP